LGIFERLDPVFFARSRKLGFAARKPARRDRFAGRIPTIE